jgi:D-glycero-D-manno-heptose 1,7-bisphosphate phosphatase
MKRAVFLDRDGTIIVEKHYLKDPAEVELIPGAAQALRRLRERGFLLIMVTNQSGIGRGYYTMADMARVNARILGDLARDEVLFEKVYFAPEAPDQPSRGRKPCPQFLFDARDEFGIDLGQSYMVGDKLADMECGWNARLRAALLVRTGHGEQAAQKLIESNPRAPVLKDLVEAVEWILRDSDQAPETGAPDPGARHPVLG